MTSNVVVHVIIIIIFLLLLLLLFMFLFIIIIIIIVIIITIYVLIITMIITYCSICEIRICNTINHRMVLHKSLVTSYTRPYILIQATPSHCIAHISIDINLTSVGYLSYQFLCNSTYLHNILHRSQD